MHIDDNDYEALVKMAEYGLNTMKASVVRTDLVKKAAIELADVGLLRRDESSNMERILANSPEAAFTSLSVVVGKLKEARLSTVKNTAPVETAQTPVFGSLILKKAELTADGLDEPTRKMLRVWGHEL